MTGAADQEIEISLRSAGEVGARLVVLATLCRRLFLEDPAAEDVLGEDREAERWDLAAWLKEYGLDAYLTSEERELLDRPAGSLSEEDLASETWLSEALVALAWSASLLDVLPPPVEPSDPGPVLARIPAPWDDVRPFLKSITLRSEEEIAMERERAEIWAWRAGIEAERRAAKGRAARELQETIAEVVREAAASGLLPSSGLADFPVDGLPLSALSEERWEQIAVIATARLHALNWLCGFGERWDDVPLDI
jgi:hypothetical protein